MKEETAHTGIPTDRPSMKVLHRTSTSQCAAHDSRTLISRRLVAWVAVIVMAVTSSHSHYQKGVTRGSILGFCLGIMCVLLYQNIFSTILTARSTVTTAVSEHSDVTDALPAVTEEKSILRLGTYSLTYSLTHLLTHSPTHSLTYSLTHLTTYSLTQVEIDFWIHQDIFFG